MFGTRHRPAFDGAIILLNLSESQPFGGRLEDKETTRLSGCHGSRASRARGSCTRTKKARGADDRRALFVCAFEKETRARGENAERTLTRFDRARPATARSAREREKEPRPCSARYSLSAQATATAPGPDYPAQLQPIRREARVMDRLGSRGKPYAGLAFCFCFFHFIFHLAALLRHPVRLPRRFSHGDAPFQRGEKCSFTRLPFLLRFPNVPHVVRLASQRAPLKLSTLQRFYMLVLTGTIISWH